MDTVSTELNGDIVELPIHCVKCGGPIEVQCSEWRSGQPAISHRFACPFCHSSNELTMSARLVWVSMRAANQGLRKH